MVLDLLYEARDIDQRLGSEEKIDAWFDAKTQGLNDWQKDELKKQWGTMQKVLSSRSRMERVVSDIIFDFSVRPRLASARGNAMLVASSIYEACKYYTLFQKTPFKGTCALLTSYDPQAQDITREDTGANTETDKQFIYNTYTERLKDVAARPGLSKTETSGEQAKALFPREPAHMQLLIVVDKLLTGFDVSPLLARWEPLLGVQVARFFVQRMNTRWGSCKHKARTIRLNTDLAKKPPECLAYIVVHEMTHILEPTHNARFVALLDQCMPHWQFYREQLNYLPISHKDWAY